MITNISFLSNIRNLCSNIFKINNRTQITYDNIKNIAEFNYINDKGELCTIKINFKFYTDVVYLTIYQYGLQNNISRTLEYYKENINISFIRSKNKNRSIYMKHNNYIDELKYSDNNKKISINSNNSNCRIIKYKRLINKIWYLIKLKKIDMSTYFYYTIYYILYTI